MCILSGPLSFAFLVPLVVKGAAVECGSEMRSEVFPSFLCLDKRPKMEDGIVVLASLSGIKESMAELRTIFTRRSKSDREIHGLICRNVTLIG